jgi:phosphopantetheinyl transferase (holo-ACP synthase)
MPSLTGADIEELESLGELTSLNGWKYVKKILNEHRIYCIEQAHKHLIKHEDRLAGEWLACSKEPHKFITLIQNRKKELSDKREKETG